MIAFIINKRSGGGKTGKIWSALEARVKNLWGDGYTVRHTEYPSHASELTGEELKKGAQTIVAVGGDGTTNEVANGFFSDHALVNPNASMGIVCIGTGSDFIHTLGWSKNPLEALERIKNGQKRLVDLGLVTFRNLQNQEKYRYFINITDFGIGGKVVDRVNHTTKIFGGKASFLWGIFMTFLTYKSQRVAFRIDRGEERTEQIYNFIVGNGRYFGSGLNPTPLAEIDDGLLDVVVIKHIPKWKFLRDFHTMFKGTHLSYPNVEYRKAKIIEATADEDVFIDMDGEMVGKLPIKLEVIPHILSLHV